MPNITFILGCGQVGARIWSARGSYKGFISFVGIDKLEFCSSWHVLCFIYYH